MSFSRTAVVAFWYRKQFSMCAEVCALYAVERGLVLRISELAGGEKGEKSK